MEREEKEEMEMFPFRFSVVQERFVLLVADSHYFSVA